MTDTKPLRLGVIGGSGFYEMEGVRIVREHDVDTPFGQPSDLLAEVDIDGRTVFFLPRHGRGHRLLPSEVPYRANIHALKQLCITHVLAVGAVGIMKEHISPGDMVVPDQVFDRTKGNRASTFFGGGVVGHVSFADPFCAEMRGLVVQAAKAAGAAVHDGGTYVCMEGPQFSTRAESHFYRRAADATVIGMTAIPEAKLAREAEMCYAVLSMGTDYDCWHEQEGDVDIESVLAILKANTRTANAVVKEISGLLPEATDCECQRSARDAIITAPGAVSDEAKHRLRVLYGHYLDGTG